MKTKKILFILALLCAVVQGAWAQDFDVWDGHSESQPQLSQDDLVNGIYTLKITSGAELHWLHENWGSNIYTPSYNVDVDECNFVLMRDLDMTAASWVPLDVFYKKFDGRGHTIKLKIRDTSDNYQGLFKQIESSGEVRNLHVDCDIKVGNATNVAGICGENEGTIENCWVSGHIESSHYSGYDADLGGIAGLNDDDGTIKYCCVAADIKNTGGNSGVGGIAGSNEGNIQHVTFYGEVSVNHSQDNKYVGDQDGTMSNNNDTFQQSEYNAASGYDVYRHALKYPYTFNISTSGFDIIGRVQVSAGGETDIPGWRYGETVTLTQTRGLVQSLTIKDADNNNVSFSGNVTDGWTFTMPRSDVNIHVVFTTPAWLNHAGTSNDPYSIETTADYEDFATIVNNAVNDFSGEYVKLTADINNITSPVGYWRSNANNKPFSGTFLGEGHTITVTLNDNFDGLAPFSYIDGATIKNLKVAGTITSSQDSQEHIAGVVGLASGNSTIEGCVVTATLNVIGENAGGIFGSGLTSATTTIRGCVFAGTINGVGDNPGRIGGIVDWYNSAEATNLEACLETGTYTNIVSMHPMGLNSSQGTITNSYYVNSEFGGFNRCTLNGAKQAIVLTSAPDNLGTLVQNYGMVKAYQNGILYDGAYYVAFTLSGAGTEGSPYTIGNASQWNDFATYVTNGYNFNGQFVKLNADIEVSTMAGASDANSFQGTFDGDGNTLTVSYNTSENWTAPFRHVKDATIKNLHVDGTINTSAQFAGGIVGESHKDLNITNCRSSVAINSSVSGDGTHGGLVSTLSGSGNTIIIEGCVFDGSFATSANTTNCGGFIGWGVYNKPTVKNSLMKPSSVPAGMLIYTFARWYTGDGGIYEPTIDNCFFFATTNMPTNQGALVVTDAEILPVGDPGAYNVSGITAYTNGISYGGNFYYNPDRNIKREITGYGEGTGKWAFIASPVEGSIAPSVVTNLLGSAIPETNPVQYNYDLFRLNSEQWENYVQHTGDFNIVNGNGYLYATKTTKNLVFSGIFNTDDSKTVELSDGFNLVGNPFGVDAYVSKPFYQMNAEGTDIVAIDNYDSYTPVTIPPCTSIVVRADGADNVTFSTSAPQQQSSANNGNLQMTLIKAGVRSDAFQDKAIVSFNQGAELEKFIFNENHAKLYIPQYGEDYAIAFSDMTGEIPLNFKANETGRYTIGFNFENVKGVRIQLIDKIEDNIIDLNKDVSGNVSTYTFMGSSVDRDDRFTLVFTQVETDGVFAYQSGNDIIVSGNGELQVFDVMGRMVMNQYINGVQTVEKPSTTGVYIFRLNGMSQKIVVK